MRPVELSDPKPCTSRISPTMARFRQGRRTIGTQQIKSRTSRVLEARWFEDNWKPDGWITLEFINNRFRDEDLIKIIRSYCANVGKLHNQHIYGAVRWGIQTKSFDKNKLHAHMLYRFEKNKVCSRIMELMWQKHIRKIVSNGTNQKLLPFIDDVVLGVLISTGHSLEYSKAEKDLYAHAYEYTHSSKDTRNGTTIEYHNDPRKHPDWYFVTGCPKRDRSCRKGRCKHYRN